MKAGFFLPCWRRLALASLLAFGLAACGDGLLFLGSQDFSGTAQARVVTDNQAPPDHGFAAALSSGQAVPATASQASGLAALMLDPDSRFFRVVIASARMSGTSAHIHFGSANVNGPIVLSLSQAGADGLWSASGTFSIEQQADLEHGNYYIDIHSTAFPNGEIRGQLLHQLPLPGNSGGDALLTLTNVMSSTQTVPANNSAARGLAITVFDPLLSVLRQGVVTNVISSTAAHLHQAQAGRNGAIILTLAETTGGSGIWITNSTLTQVQAELLAADALYIDVHSSLFPEGEIRGQVAGSAASGGSTGSNGLDNGTGSIGTGTGSAAIGTATGSSSIGTGTGGAAINTGTGSASINTGTGSASINSGTGSASISSGTGSAAIDSSTGSASLDTGTGSNSIGTASGAAAVGSGTGSASVGTGSGASGLGVSTGSGSVSGVVF